MLGLPLPVLIFTRIVLMPSLAYDFVPLDFKPRFQFYYERIAKPFEWKFTRRDLHALLNKIKGPLKTPYRLAA
jgi:hypothetical protein